MRNPFTIGIVESKEDFCDRVKEAKDLINYARSGANVVLFSPRRYGKSSLVTKVQKDLAKEGLLTIYVDFFPVSSEQDFIDRFASAIFKGIGRNLKSNSFIDKVKGFFKLLRPTLEVGSEGYSISVKFDRPIESETVLEDLMTGLYDYVKKNKLAASIVLDEFQEITGLSESKKIEGVLRSHMQFHKEISYFYVGSRRRILQDIFNDESRPFYKSAFFYPVDKIQSADFVPYIGNCFKKTGKICERDVADDIYKRVKGYPYYVQKLAFIAWSLTEKVCDKSVVDQAYQFLVCSEEIDFEGIWSGLSMVQKSVLKALALEPTSTPYSRSYLEKFQLSVGGVQKALNSLVEKDLVEKRGKVVYQLTDPIFEVWLKI